ncbi:tetratricopeptide repeat protein [Polyangium aurulentum]|uniref:tetratricopeptide repeat protein n=1 Tax=Polyangium aurulentum TaxID=2567896 RepID=UPI0010AEBF3A|nr:tetratricopeptide repeat protein [Polyangium aurulentum]UQA54986.1 tetratricopeptide repeat protein [Polyangium aurulentum]
MSPKRAHEQQLIRLHRLLAEGKGETEEHEALCESMLESWKQLDATTRELFRGLSGDLDMLEGTERLEATEEDTAHLSQEIERTWKEKDFPRVLALLRKVQAPFFPADRVAYVRGRCWNELGFPEAAHAFYEHASKLNPDNGNYAYLALIQALSLGWGEQVVAKANAVADDPHAHARALFAAAHALLRTDASGQLGDERLYRKIVGILQRAVAAETRLPASLRRPSVLAGGYVELGFCYERLQDPDLARRAYTEALQIDPKSDAAFTARGLLLSSTEPDKAALDFAQAVSLKTPLVWPYLFLARHTLLTGDYGRTVELCEEGLKRTDDPGQRANLFEWLALAKAALSEPKELVEEIFEQALDLSPLNLRIQRNKEIALGAAPPESGERPWQVASDTLDDEARLQFRQQFRQQTLAAA